MSSRTLSGLSLASLSLASTTALGAQTVRGAVVEPDGTRPVVGGIVTLLGDRGAPLATALTNDDGAFELRAPGAGRVTLRVERVGFRTVNTPPLELRQGETVTRRVVMGTARVDLQAMRVTASQRCVVRPAEGELAATLWEEARKVLAATGAAQREQRMTLPIRYFEREPAPPGEASRRGTSPRARRDDAWERDQRVARPFVAVDPAVLEGQGYVRRRPDGSFDYSAPDADLLLSDAFLGSHCLRPQATDSAPGLVGIAFEPVRERRRPDVGGVLWLDRERATLRALDFGYRNLGAVDRDLESEGRLAGGRVEFAQLPNGRWVVSRWRIRMPLLSVARDRFGSSAEIRDVTVLGVAESGAEVVRVLSNDAPLARAAVVTGVASDSLLAIPLGTARVRLATDRPTRGPDSADVALDATADAAGRFTIAGVPPGRYRLTLLARDGDAHPDSLFRAAPTRTLVVSGGDTAVADVAYPSLRTETARRCGGRVQPDSLVVVFGEVRERGVPVSDVRLTARWNRVGGAPGSGAPTRVVVAANVAEGSTGSDGRYALCGVPTRTPVTVAVDGGRGAPSTPLRPEPGRLYRVDLDLGASPPVRAASSATATMLPTVDVRARAEAPATPLPEAFARRRAAGIGRFLTQQDFANGRGQRLTEVVQAKAAGLSIVRARTGGAAWIAGGRGPSTHGTGSSSADRAQGAPANMCWAAVVLNGVPVYSGRAGEALFDMNSVATNSIIAVELYGTATQVPTELAGAGLGTCGLVAIWTR